MFNTLKQRIITLLCAVLLIVALTTAVITAITFYTQQQLVESGRYVEYRLPDGTSLHCERVEIDPRTYLCSRTDKK